tara:strand:+ start:378 stop:2726 length:2349 start_codon:yes stop_codon:yes gene_type:complete
MAEPKYRTVKIPKPRSRGFRGRAALQQWQRSGGRQKQILNPETGKYEKALFGEAGQRQVQKLYPTKERGESIKKVEKAKVEQAKRQKAGAAEAKKKAAAIAAKPKAKFKRDSRILDSFNATPLGKSGDGKVTFDDQTGKYVLDAFGAKKSYTADELKKEIAKSKEPKFKEDSKLVDAFNKTPLGKSGDGKVTFDPNTGKYVLDAFGAKKSYTADELNKEIKGAKPPKADPMPQLPPQPTPPAPTAADTKAQLASIAEKRRAERGARSEPTPPPAPVAKDNKFKELLDKIDAGGGKLADLPPLPSRPTAPQPVTEIKADSPPPTTGRLTRGPGPEAPPPPPRVRITEEVPKPPAPSADLSGLSGRDQAELNTVLKDLKNRVVSPDFKTPTQAEIAEAVTKATGGRFTPPTPKVAEPPPPKAEPVVPAPTGGMSRVKRGTGESGSLSQLFPVGGRTSQPSPDEMDEFASRYGNKYATPSGGPTIFEDPSPIKDVTQPKVIDIPGGGQVEVPSIPAPPDAPTTPSVVTPDELRAMAKRLTDAAADPSTTTSELMALNKQVQEATKQLQDQTSQRQAERQAQTGKTDEEILAEAKAIVAGMGPTPTPTPTPAEPPMQVRTADFQDANNNGIDDRDEPDSGGTFMPMPGEPPPREAPPAAPPPPTFVNMDPLQGVRQTYVPTNILGPSYDPNVREDYIQKMMQAGANIQQGGYPGFQMPTSAVPQVQFGGYGAPAPMAPLAPYAGLAAPPQPYSGAIVNPGTGEPEPVGMAPDPRLVNRPPGTGPIM